MENPIGTNFRYPSGMGWGGSGIEDADEVFAEIDSAFGSVLVEILTLKGRVGAKVATIAALKALTTDRADEKLYPCDDIGTGVNGLYQYDAASAATESLPDVVEPDDHTGRFFLKSDAGVTMPKVAAGHADEILAATAGGTAALTGILKTQVPSVDQKAALAGTSGTAPSAANPLVDNLDVRLDYAPVLGRFDNGVALPAAPVAGDRYIAHVTANGWTAERIYQCVTGGSWVDQIEQVPVAGRTVYNRQIGAGCVAVPEGVQVFTVAGSWAAIDATAGAVAAAAMPKSGGTFTGPAFYAADSVTVPTPAATVTPGAGNTGEGSMAVAAGVRSDLFEIEFIAAGELGGAARFKWRHRTGVWQDNAAAGYPTAADVELTYDAGHGSGQHVQFTAGGTGADDFSIGDTYAFTPVLEATAAATAQGIRVVIPLVTPKADYDDVVVHHVAANGAIHDGPYPVTGGGGFTTGAPALYNRETAGPVTNMRFYNYDVANPVNGDAEHLFLLAL